MHASIIVWLTPTLLALVAWGIGQGLVKKNIGEVSPARFCLFFVVAKAVVNFGYFLSNDHPDPFAAENLKFAYVGIFAYVLDGSAWILYFLSIVAGPITIVGTLSAAFPALTVLLAWFFLGEQLLPIQYVAVALVISGCIGLSYAPAGDGTGKIIKKYWVIYAGLALLLWGSAQVIVKHAYTFEGASEANMALFNTIGGVLTLGIYGGLYGRTSQRIKGEWFRSFLPMGMMAAGDLFVIIALSKGPSSMVTPISGAYPLVTLLFARFILSETISRFQWLCIALIMAGLFFTST
jgi:transporter family protein